MDRSRGFRHTSAQPILCGVSSPTPPGQDSPPPVTESLSPWAEQLRDLGQLLRQSRESQGLQAETVADRLRIGVEQLQALETAELDRLPEPVFVIAQARRVAGALDLLGGKDVG